MSEANDIIKPTDALLAELRGMIAEARDQVAQAANAALTMLFWRIGQRIHSDILREKRADYGKRIVASLGRHLTAEFGACFGEKKLRRMIQFAEVFPKEEEKLNRIVDHAELKKNDYNISPSRYIHTGDAETYRPLAEIVAELDMIEAEARETDKALRDILEKLGVGA